MYDKNSPYEVELKAGQTVYLCRCGKTQSAPYCDGSHSSLGGVVEPLAHTADKDGKAYVCGCGKSGNIPWCDGSHSR
jgi:CDGSH-type Zn-finger protein